MTNQVYVIFRADGPRNKPEITAVFPCEPADLEGNMSCYAHIGQHSACGFEWYRTTRPAKPAEYADLLAELKNYGSGDDKPYANLRIAKRIHAHMRDMFRAALSDMRKA
jgi:hypothetical protein